MIQDLLLKQVVSELVLPQKQQEVMMKSGSKDLQEKL